MLKAVRRVKWAGSFVVVLAAVGYFGTSLSGNMNDYIAFAEAEEDFIIMNNPQTDLNENGKIATAKF